MSRTATKKEPLQDAALRLFVEKGIAGTTTREIADAAGIAEGTIYRHYPSKDALAWDLYSRNLIHFSMDVNRLQAQEPTLKEKIFKMVNLFYSLYDTNQTLFRYLLLSQHDLIKRMTPELPNPTTVVVNVMKEAMDKGEIPKRNPELAAAMVMGVVLQTAIAHIYERLNGKLSNMTQEVTEACWRVLEK